MYYSLLLYSNYYIMVLLRRDGLSLLSTMGSNEERREKIMLETIALVLIVLWILGMVSSTTMGGLIHVLLVIAVAVILIRVIQGRRAI